MDRTYALNDLAVMTGFTTRTLRNYLSQGLLTGEKLNGLWHFSAEDLDRFFQEPFVKEGLRIKRSSAVFDFMAARNREEARTCVILDLPASLEEGNQISSFFCAQMEQSSHASFTFGWEKGFCRVILNGAADSVAEMMKAYYARAELN